MEKTAFREHLPWDKKPFLPTIQTHIFYETLLAWLEVHLHETPKPTLSKHVE